MIYENGLIFEFGSAVPATISYGQAGDEIIGEYCLNNTRTGKDRDLLTGSVYISSQVGVSSIVSQILEEDSLVEVEDIFGISEEEMIEAAQAQEDLCLKTVTLTH